jgi:hypothetical protein
VTDFPKLAKFLKWFPSRNSDMTQEELNDIAYSILPKEQFSALAEFLDGKSFDKKAALWEYYGKSSRIFSLYLRPIFTTLDVEYYKENSYIGGLIDVLKSHYAIGKTPSELKICDDLGFTVPKGMTRYLKRKPTDIHIDPYLFEFYVYQKIYHEIDRGRLYCNDSVSYCDIDVDLVDDALVDDAERILFVSIPYVLPTILSAIIFIRFRFLSSGISWTKRFWLTRMGKNLQPLTVPFSRAIPENTWAKAVVFLYIPCLPTMSRSMQRILG